MNVQGYTFMVGFVVLVALNVFLPEYTKAWKDGYREGKLVEWCKNTPDADAKNDCDKALARDLLRQPENKE